MTVAFTAMPSPTGQNKAGLYIGTTESGQQVVFQASRNQSLTMAYDAAVRRRGARDQPEKVDPVENTRKGRLAFENMLNQAAMDGMHKSMLMDWLDEFMPPGEEGPEGVGKKFGETEDQETEEWRDDREAEMEAGDDCGESMFGMKNKSAVDHKLALDEFTAEIERVGTSWVR